MFCRLCGARLSDDDVYCSECGSAVFRTADSVESAGNIPAGGLSVNGYVADVNDDTAVTLSQDSSEGNWIYGFSGKNKVKVYADTNVNSALIAELPVKSPLYLGQEVKVSAAKWFMVKLPDEQIGYIQPGVPIITQPGMVSTIKSWAAGMIFIGALSIVFSAFLDPIWGALLIIIGVLAMIIKKRFMFIVFGFILILVGFMNILVGGQWMVFGGLQIIWGLSEFYKFNLYGVLSET